MGTAVMNKVLTVLGLADKVNEDTNIDETESFDYDDEYQKTQVEETINEVEENFVADKQEEKSGFGFYKPKKTKEIDEYIPSISRRSVGKVLPMSSSATSKMVISQPQSFDDSKEIADNVIAKKSVIVNLESVSHEDARRIIDFLSGTAHAIDGTIQKVSKLILLIAPKNIEVQNEAEKYNYSSKINMSWLKK
ncbi:MAG: cell division protein SepF [Clostridia bacterium]